MNTWRKKQWDDDLTYRSCRQQQQEPSACRISQDRGQEKSEETKKIVSILKFKPSANSANDEEKTFKDYEKRHINTYRIRFKHSAYDQSGEDLGRQTRDFSEGQKGDLKHQECNREQQTVITFLSSVLSASQINCIPPTSMKIMVLGRAGCFDASTCTCVNVCCFCLCLFCFVLFCFLKMSVVLAVTVMSLTFEITFDTTPPSSCSERNKGYMNQQKGGRLWTSNCQG